MNRGRKLGPVLVKLRRKLRSMTESERQEYLRKHHPPTLFKLEERHQAESSIREKTTDLNKTKMIKSKRKGN